MQLGNKVTANFPTSQLATGNWQRSHNNHAAVVIVFVVVVACCIWGDHLDCTHTHREREREGEREPLANIGGSSVSMLGQQPSPSRLSAVGSPTPSLVCGTHAPSSAPRNALHEMQNVSSGGDGGPID